MYHLLLGNTQLLVVINEMSLEGIKTSHFVICSQFLFTEDLL